jgi:hypothetical protein
MIVKFFMIFNYTPLYNDISFRFNARIFVAELLLRSAHANHLTYCNSADIIHPKGQSPVN